MHYDLNGNMRSFERYNDDEILKYKYLLDGNQLVRVKRYPGTKDSEGKVAFGIEEADNPFEYDTMGNLVYDGQNQLKISYDFLNLPEKIAPAELHSQAGELFLANYCYLWNGEKIASADVRESGYLYIGSVRYSLDSAKPAFESAPFAMGRIGRLGEEYDTRYFLNDHLGSVRAIVNQNGVVTAEYDYMPYGMQHKNSSLATSDDNTFRYNGKEFLSRFCVDLYDSQARLQGMNARFNSIDPLAGEMPDISPYAYCAGNPIKNIDPDGMQQITSDVNDKPENKREKEEYNKQLEWREQFERSFWFRPSQPLNTPTTDKDEEDKPLSHKIFTSGAVFALGASQIDSPVIGPGDVAAVFILLGSAAAAGITDLIMEFSQHGKNDGRLSQEELEILLEKKAQGTLTGKEKKKLNSHEKNKKNRHSRQSKDIKKSKKK